MADKEEVCFTVRLAQFNEVSTVDGRVYNMGKTALREFMDKQIGKPIGEIGTAALSGNMENRLNRISTIDTFNSAGILRGYDIADDDGRLVVTGHVVFSPALKQAIDAVNDQQPTFGLRGLGQRNPDDGSMSIEQLIAFDYVDPTRRL